VFGFCFRGNFQVGYMRENLMNPAHKATNKTYRDNYDVIFRRSTRHKDKSKYTRKKKHRWAE